MNRSTGEIPNIGIYITIFYWNEAYDTPKDIAEADWYQHQYYQTTTKVKKRSNHVELRGYFLERTVHQCYAITTTGTELNYNIL